MSPSRPLQPRRFDTPDRMLPPKARTPSAKEDAVEPRDAMQGTYDLIEYVPLGDTVAKAACGKQTGPYPRQIEQWSKRKVYGKQSAADCEAIQALRKRHKTKPASGFAGIARSARRMMLHLPQRWPWRHALTQLFCTVHAPPGPARGH